MLGCHKRLRAEKERRAFLAIAISGLLMPFERLFFCFHLYFVGLVAAAAAAAGSGEVFCYCYCFFLFCFFFCGCCLLPFSVLPLTARRERRAELWSAFFSQQDVDASSGFNFCTVMLFTIRGCLFSYIFLNTALSQVWKGGVRGGPVMPRAVPGRQGVHGGVWDVQVGLRRPAQVEAGVGEEGQGAVLKISLKAGFCFQRSELSTGPGRTKPSSMHLWQRGADRPTESQDQSISRGLCKGFFFCRRTQKICF